MTVRQDDEAVRLEGDCRVEDAEPLAALLQSRPEAVVDLSGCTGLHAAVLQVLLAHATPITGSPADPFLAQWIAPLLLRQGVAKCARA